ncbi:MAG: hypothetical protein IH818_09925 [Acidobacteria bacterium]|nr:hypothetical protein [Acidobacteriota bacterium]
MSYPESQTIKEVRYVSCCGSAGFWGVLLVLIGVAALLPYDLSRYVWPTVAIAAGVWLLFGPLDWPRRYRHFDDPFDPR